MRRFIIPCLIVFVALAAGCRGGGGRAPVTGRVQMDGQPLTNATVSFIPREKTSGAHLYSGQTDETGAYTLKADDGQPGAVPGDYRVEISVIDRGSPSKGGLHNRVPARYNHQSTLSFTVPPAGTREANFLDLESK